MEEQPLSAEQHLGKNVLVITRLLGRTEPIFLTPAAFRLTASCSFHLSVLEPNDFSVQMWDVFSERLILSNSIQ